MYVKTQRESPNLMESIMFSTRKRRRSSRIARFNLSVALVAISLTRSGETVTSLPVAEEANNVTINRCLNEYVFNITTDDLYYE